MDLREAVIREVNSALVEVGIPKGWQWDVFEVVKITDRILAIPEIRDALELSPAIIANRDDTIRDMALEIAELRIKYEPSAQP